MRSKVFWFLMLSVIILIIVGSALLAAEPLANDNFDKAATGSKPEGYIIEATGGNVEIAEVPGPTDKSLYLFDPGATVIRIAKKFTPQKGIVVAEASFMQPALGSTAKAFRLLSPDAPSDPNEAAVHIETRSGGKFAYKNSDGSYTELAGYQANKWYRIKIVADVAAKKANVYIDGELKLKEAPFMKPVEEIGAFDSYTPGSATKGHYLDNIKIYPGQAADLTDPGKTAADASAAVPALSGGVALKVPAAVADLIAEVSVYDTERANYWSVKSNLQIHDQIFGDRSFLIVTLPEKYAGYDWISPAADSKRFYDKVLVSFNVKTDLTVYIAHDDRIVEKPAWFTGWTDTGDAITDNGYPRVTYSIYEKSFRANETVALGENGGSTGCIQYFIIIKGPRAPQAAAKSSTPVSTGPITWNACLTQKPEWYAGAEAIRIADNVLLYQRDTGGWYKNIDMAVKLTEANKAALLREKKNTNDSTIDNNATTDQMKYLALVYNATKEERFKEGFLKGLDFLLKAQYPNGGWPQYYPRGAMEYHMRITYNDDAMIRVMSLLREIAGSNPPYGFADQERKQKAAQAVAKGIDCILKTQIRVNGKLTAWCAQHDQVTLAPAPARSYELESISGQETVGIVRFLMGIDKPSPQIIESVQAAVAWLDAVKLTGIKVVDKPDKSLPGGFDRVVLNDPNAPAIWARFYEIGTNRPFFCGRDGVKKYSLAEIEHERRTGYSWYTSAPAFMLAKEYPVWQAKWAPHNNVLQKSK